MRKSSGTVLAVLLGFTLGCGGKTDAPSDAKPEPAPVQPGGTNQPVDPGNKQVIPAAVPATWEMDPAKHTVPTGPVSGKIRGESVTLLAQAEKEAVRFLVNKDGLGTTVVEIHLSDPEKSTEGLTLSIKPDGTGIDVPNVIVWNPVKAGDEPQVLKNGFALTLSLGKREKGKVTGKVYLSLADQQKSFIAGTFEADWIRPIAELPTADDAPFIQGKLTVAGATDANVWYGVLRVDPLDPMRAVVNIHGTELKPGAMPLRSDSVRPLSLIVPGAKGMGDPARYEITKLEPGRYWVFANVKGGPMAWKWVDVTPTTQATLDFTIDAANFGSLAVTAPGDAKSVSVVPAAESGKPWPESVISSASSIVDLFADNAKPDPAKPWSLTFPRLAPGKYEVWSGDDKLDVEIKAKETAKLEFKKK